jgi:hypothetical protein
MSAPRHAWPADQAATVGGQDPGGLTHHIAAAALDAAAEAHLGRDYETAILAACIAVDALAGVQHSGRSWPRQVPR